MRLLKGDEARRGLTAVLSVRMSEPEFGATKTCLRSKRTRGIVGAGVRPLLEQFFASNPVIAEAVVKAAIAEDGERA
jgi:DNA gyrase subunit B